MTVHSGVGSADRPPSAGGLRPPEPQYLLPKVHRIASCSDLDDLVQELDLCIDFRRLTRIFSSGVGEFAYLGPWFITNHILEQAGEVVLEYGEDADAVDRISAARLYLIIYTVHIILHNELLVPAVERELPVVRHCLRVLGALDPSGIDYRVMDGLEGVRKAEITAAFETVESFDSYLVNLDALDLFKPYTHEARSHRIPALQKPPPGFTVKSYLACHKTLNSGRSRLDSERAKASHTLDSEASVAQTPPRLAPCWGPDHLPQTPCISSQPSLKYSPTTICIAAPPEDTPPEPHSIAPLRAMPRSFSPYIGHSRSLSRNSMETHDMGPVLFNFHMLRTNSLNEFDIQVLQFITAVRVMIYRVLLALCSEDQLLEKAVKRIGELLEGFSHGEPESPLQFEKELIPLLELITRCLRIQRIFCESQHIYPYSLREARHPSTPSVELAFRTISDICMVTRTVMGWSPMLLLLAMRPRRLVPMYSVVYEKVVTLLDNVFLVRASLAFQYSPSSTNAQPSSSSPQPPSPAPAPLTSASSAYTPVSDDPAASLFLSLWEETAVMEKEMIQGGLSVSSFGYSQVLLQQILFIGKLIQKNLDEGLIDSALDECIEAAKTTIVMTLFSLKGCGKAFLKGITPHLLALLRSYSTPIYALALDIHTGARKLARKLRGLSASELEIYQAYCRIIEALFKIIQSVLGAGIIVIDANIVSLSIKYIVSYVSAYSFCTSCWVLRQLIPCPEISILIGGYSLDGLSIKRYLMERISIASYDPICESSLTSLIAVLK
ncbi:hypothetical protein GMRT_11907 [Giardia muris]|uniref:Uncharacterized protein n=1 Tax=Giardia muris TaxID=5742 RepID=A0A4Z1SRY4_GIAMU|nr:hypothetical protein GMRT_11907 [Giardia muris]|eukprot:TNJ28520.1 hypothetical protein GMRT_11907 [Giardia muris]